ncbi:DUF2029 domain-containing protein [Microlunatus elymi]|uniref:DUF2029 domain-containing protein n=1 Tax=Microlunatus elymi TaxID=2596828 RepID=A0A516Q0W2_9ACTN|nr:glycosyltransferase family 87 protein [Microlunatus elymi]QDP97075.1 DUF2029 domain-containing protein [Microlunatus elymi]
MTRAIMVLLALTIENVATGDVSYYWRKIDALGHVGLAETLNEYPTPVVWMLAIPYAIGFGSQTGYLIAFIALMMLLDAAFTFVLYRAAGNRRDPAVLFWLFFVFLIGPLSYLRFDLVPAVLAGLSLLVARRQPWLTGALTGLGAAIKLWPALLIFPFAGYRRGRRATLIGFVVAGFGLALISLMTGGPKRLFSPLTWQSDRGLQIESLWATGLMFLRMIDPATWVVAMSRYQAFEVFGPAVGTWLVISNLATFAGLIVMIALYVRILRLPEPSTGVTGLVVLSTVAIMIITNKTLSPQYLLWLGGPLAAVLIMRARDLQGRLTVYARLGLQVLALALLTHLVYPLTYFGLYGDRHGALFVTSTTLLVLRNLGLLVFTIALVATTWRATRPSSPARPLSARSPR